MVRFWMGWGGSLLCDQPIDGVTQELRDKMAEEYGGPYFVGETITRLAGETIAKALGGEFIDKPNAPHQARAVASRPECGCSASSSERT